VTAGQHAGLSLDRWRGYPLGQQLLMIANEMNRASKLLGAEDHARLLSSYERVLALTDLTIGAAGTRSQRRELLRWRDLVAGLYVAPSPDLAAHGSAFRALLQLHPEAWSQRHFVTGAAPF
jgi:hypothetical protein